MDEVEAELIRRGLPVTAGLDGLLADERRAALQRTRSYLARLAATRRGQGSWKMAADEVARLLVAPPPDLPRGGSSARR